MPEESFSLTVPQPDRPAESARRIRREQEDLSIVRRRGQSCWTRGQAVARRVVFNKVKETYSRWVIGYRIASLAMFKFCKQKTKSSIRATGSISRLRQGARDKVA